MLRMSRSNTPLPDVADTIAHQRLQEALRHFQSGDTTRAEAMCKSILRSSPLMEAAHLLLTRAQRVQGFNKHALQSCKAGIRALPKSVALLIEMALIQRSSGRMADAQATYRHILAVEPNNATAMHNLANLLQSTGTLDEAESLYRKVLSLQPQMAAAHFELGNVLAARQEPSAALLEWQRAVQVQPQLAQAWFKIGEALPDGRRDEAMNALRTGLLHDPNDARGLSLLSKLLSDSGRSAEGEQYALMALRIDPKLPLAHYALGLACRIQGRTDAALNALSVAARTSDVAALRNEAVYLQTLCHIDQKRFSLALPLAEALMPMSQTDQQRGVAHHLIGSVLFDAGRVPEAREHFAAAVRISPNFIQHRISHTANALYVDEDSGQAHRALAEHLLGTLNVQPARPPDVTSTTGQVGAEFEPPRRIKLGWLSGDFRLHSCAFFLEPLLEKLDPNTFEFFAYDTGSRMDAVMARFQQLIPNWRSVAHLQAADLAQTIAADRLDVLVDLAGLTDGGRIESLAAQPAPVQMSWLGYLGTSGHPAIQYRLTDRWAESPIGPACAVEQPIVLERPYVCYRAPADAPDVSSLPMLIGDGPVFGSFNVLSKLSDHTVALWSTVLHAIPNARLLLKTMALADEAVKAHTLARFAAQGIHADRLELMGWATEVKNHLELYHRVDVALDPFPYNGVTTTCEALWMGVPVVSLVGQTICSRQGHTLLSAVGLPELACHNGDELVQRCMALVSDMHALSELRSQLRNRMAGSPLCDATDMANAFTEAIHRVLKAA